MNHVGDFSEATLAQELSSVPGSGERHPWYVAFSGGLDSTVLLYSLSRIESARRTGIIALHANHGLHEDADLWLQRCRSLCDGWGLGFESVRLQLPATAKTGIEAAARSLRYEWLARQLPANGILLTAHHLNDQAETVLANLFRGAGSHGLRGIHRMRRLGAGWVWRPLLGVERSALARYARQQGLDWIEDPANRDLRYTRNVLRHDILPAVEKTWPGVLRALGRHAEVSAETAALLDEFAHSDLKSIERPARPPFFVLSVPTLVKLSKPRCLNLMRYWFRCCGFEVPSKARLLRVFECLINMEPPSTTVLSWKGVEVRRYRTLLYLSPPLTAPPIAPTPWDGVTPLAVNHGQLVATPVMGRGIRASAWQAGPITVRSRTGGERVLPQGSRYHRKLKTLLQEKGVPPWERDRIPLLYIGDELVSVVGLCYCAPYAASAGERGVEVDLR